MISSMETTSNTGPETKGQSSRRVSFGDGLFRYERPGGTSSWVCRVQHKGNWRDFGLGSCKTVGLEEARERAQVVRRQVEQGYDPQFERRKVEAVPRFKDAAQKVFDIHSTTWRNGKHHGQWMRTMEMYAFPQLGKMRVDRITGPMIRDVLMEIWLAKPETARRVRQRIGMVLDWAYASGYRESEAPMRAITKRLPRQPRRDGHFPAMPYEKVPKFIQKLRARESFSRLALEFAIFTAARSGEVRGMTWDEVDLESGLWTLPKERMEAFREHVVPLKQLGREAVNTTLRIQMPPGTAWQGLPLAYIEQSDVQIPESHGATTRELAVYASLSTFRDTLTRLKQDAPAFPDGKQVEYPGYGATVQTDQRGSLAILRCVSND